MTTAARASSQHETDSLPHTALAAEKRSSVVAPKPRAKRPPRNKVAKTSAPAQQLVLLPAPKREAQLGTLLVGAGLGAAVALSVVALGSRVAKSSAFRASVAKSVALAVAGTSARGSMINLMARVVGSALA